MLGMRCLTIDRTKPSVFETRLHSSYKQRPNGMASFRRVALAAIMFVLVTSAIIWRQHIKSWSDHYSDHARLLLLLATNTSSQEGAHFHNATIHQDRLAVTCYVPKGTTQVFYFLSLLYGSWKYIIDERKALFGDERNKYLMFNVDLLVFCHPNVCQDILSVCDLYKANVNRETFNFNACWAIKQPYEIDIPYGPINSFIMFNRTDIYDIFQPYQYILRTDFDVFLTPALFTWRPNKRIVTGHGGYCDTFNRKRLKHISNKLGLVHRGTHCLGSTWFGETDFFIMASKKTIELTAYLFLNEFTPGDKGLESVNFTANREGEWPKWWRPVSSMYGAELALNHLLPDISSDYIGELDTPSCSAKKIWRSPHIHCWHSDCEFQKFKFMNRLTLIVQQKDHLSADIVHKILENVYKRDIREMTISEYSTYIAWHSVATHLRKWFL